MICESCGRETPLTYRNLGLRLKSVCAQCIREKYQVDERTLLKAVDDALFWLHEHPHRDYVDAAYAVVADPKARTDAGSTFSTWKWQVFVAAVKFAVQTEAVVS